MLPAQGHCRGRNHDLSERADAFQMVNRNGQAGFFFDLDPERQMISDHHGSRRRQVKGVLDDGHDVSFRLVRQEKPGDSNRLYRTLPDRPAPAWAERW